MKICILTQYYPPEIGAPQSRIYALARGFRECGHKVFVLTAMPSYPQGYIYDGYGGILRREEQDGISIVRTYVYPSQSVGKIKRLLNYFSFTLSSLLFASIIMPRVDYLIAESPPLFLGISGYLVSRLKRARLIFNVADLWPKTLVSLGMMRKGLNLRIAYALESFCYKKSWLVVALTKGIRGDIQQRFPHTRIYYLPSGADTNLFNPGCRSKEARKKLVGDENAIIAIYAGVHGLIAGLEQILEAAAKLRDLDNLYLVFVGDGPEKKRLIKLKENLGLTQVLFFDPYPHEDIAVLLASADIALVTVKKGFPDVAPAKLYETMSAALPVVLAHDGEAADILRRAGAGIVVPPEDAESLALALRDLAQSETKRKQLGACARQFVAANFERRKNISHFITFLEERIPRV